MGKLCTRAGLALAALTILILVPVRLQADTLTLANGDKVSGTLEHADAAKVYFKSASLGELQVDWKDIASLSATEVFVVMPKTGAARRGPIEATATAITVAGAAVPVASIHEIMLGTDFDKSFQHIGLAEDWQGTVSAGFSQVAATQSSTSLTAAAALQRPIPSLVWLPRASDTIVNFQAAYGRLSQPSLPVTRTSIVTFGIEQQENLTPQQFVLGDANLAHNYAQGLEFQQEYGLGYGWNLYDTEKFQLSLTADAHWTHQDFLDAPMTNLYASNLSENLTRKWGSVVWTESATAAPCVNVADAYQASAATSLAVPVHKKLNVSVGIVDSFIGNPPPGFQKNSFQFSTGLQWSLP